MQVYLWLVVVAAGCGGAPSSGEVQSESTSCVGPVVEGVDVSDIQPGIDWAAARAAGIQFAYAKATQGTYNTQKTFAANWSHMATHGVVRGAYHFFDPTEDGVAQAQHFLSIVGKMRPNDLPPMLDIECPDGDPACLGWPGGSGATPPSTVRQRALDWINTVAVATHKRPVIYTYFNYFSGNQIDNTGLEAFPLVLGKPTGRPSCTSVPAPWKSVSIWQYSWSGVVAGIPGQVDRDKFLGTTAQLKEFARARPAWNCAWSDVGGKQLWTCEKGMLNRCDATGAPEQVACATGCKDGARGADDQCSWSCDNSAFAGKQIQTCSGGSLFECDASGHQVMTYCANGCSPSYSSGADDVCQPPPINWDCAGSAFGGNEYWTCSSGDLYKCDANGNALQQSCGGNGCKSNPIATDDACRPAGSPGITWNCSQSGGANGSQFWTCSNGNLFECDSTGNGVEQSCSGLGCKSNAAGVNDQCYVAAPSWSCATSQGSDGNQYFSCASDGNLYKCAGSTPIELACSNGCSAGAANTDSTCR